MSKVVTSMATTHSARKFALDRETHYVACDDGSSYLFQWSDAARKWRYAARFDRDGNRSQSRGQLPKYVAVHMDGWSARNGDNWEK